MSQSEYSDRQELENEVKDYSREIETLGERQKDHQEDLENLQERLQKLKMSKGVYSDSDNELHSAMETAIQTRETDVETCKEQIGSIKEKMEPKLENLKQSIHKNEERVTQMEETLESLNHTNEGIVINITNEIERQKDDIEDAKEKGNTLKQAIEIAAGLGGVGVAASGMAELLNALQSIGIIK